MTDYRADVTDNPATGPIPYPELRAVLDDLVSSARAILADDLIGFYLVGSFAVGDADLQSDCDFIAVTRRPVTSGQENHLRVLHSDIPTRNGLWTKNLEGSYAPLDDLGTLDALGRQWLYIDRGWRKMQWSTHCNSLEQRWALRERGVVLAGPSPATFAAPVPATLLRAAMAERLPRLLDDLATWIDIGKIAWGQRWASATPWKASVACSGRSRTVRCTPKLHHWTGPCRRSTNNGPPCSDKLELTVLWPGIPANPHEKGASTSRTHSPRKCCAASAVRHRTFSDLSPAIRELGGTNTLNSQSRHVSWWAKCPDCGTAYDDVTRPRVRRDRACCRLPQADRLAGHFPALRLPPECVSPIRALRIG